MLKTLRLLLPHKTCLEDGEVGLPVGLCPSGTETQSRLPLSECHAFGRLQAEPQPTVAHWFVERLAVGIPRDFCMPGSGQVLRRTLRLGPTLAVLQLARCSHQQQDSQQASPARCLAQAELLKPAQEPGNWLNMWLMSARVHASLLLKPRRRRTGKRGVPSSRWRSHGAKRGTRTNNGRAKTAKKRRQAGKRK